MDLESFELVVLRRPADATEYDEPTLDRIQAEHLAYLAALREVGPTESASTSGYLAYLAALGRAVPPQDLLLYAATVSFEVMPMGGDEGDPGAMAHGGIDLTWFAGGALTPVSKPLTAVG